MEKVGGQAQELLYWVRQVAVTTPFSVTTLGSTLAMAQAYGFTTEEAKKLIVSTGNFTAAMGLEDEVLKRIIYNMGQMTAAGKPTGRELRDLSNSFVPIGILAERFGKRMNKSKAEILDMFSSGKISAKAFIAEFEAMVDEDFPNAMERMSKTFAAVINNLKDLMQSLIGYEIFGPVADLISSQMQSILSGLLSEESYTQAARIGQTILDAYERLSFAMQASVIPAFSNFFSLFKSSSTATFGFAESLLTATAYVRVFLEGLSSGVDQAHLFMEQMIRQFGSSFSALGVNMFKWGQNVIFQFAKGIVAGITFVFQAISAVAATITKMLQAHSPPLILPELEQWGASAMLSYMKGWSSVGVDTFDSIGSLLESAIKSWGEEDKISIPKIVTSQVALSKAIEEFEKFGVVSTGSLNAITEAAGFSSEELGKLLQNQQHFVL